MIQAVRGTKDLLPINSISWHFVESVFRNVSSYYGFNELRTPVFEKTEVFSRSIGDETDIVNKEMYSFEDRGKESLTLRPEGTAALVRAVIQNSLLQDSPLQKLWYFGPFFRYERPQKGRMRQFHQYGAELIGSSNPEADVEIIMLANEIFTVSGVKEYKLLLNTLGTDETRKQYREALTEYLKESESELSEDSQNRLKSNPLRILDSKSENDKAILKNAPIILDFLDDDSKNHFEKVKELLNSANIEYDITPNLVRGLDYYSHTVFEFQSSALGSQDSIGGGGRYDGLFQQLGFKKPVPAVGFALGVERLMLILEETNNLPDSDLSPDLFIVTINKELFGKVISLSKSLRASGIKVAYDLQGKSVKAQFREANKSKAKYSVAIGDDEINNNKVQIKNMSDGSVKDIDLNKISDFNFK